MNKSLTSISSPNWLPWVLLAISTAILQLSAAYPALRLDLPSPPTRWLYTSLTCHLVHVTTRHWIYNVLALAVIAFLFYQQFNWRSWLLTFVLSALCISLGLTLFPQGLHNYAGLSGILHGYFAMGCLLLFPRQPWLASVYGVSLLIKLVVEPFTGSVFIAHPGFVVAHSAHVYGVMGGVLAWAIVYYFRWQRAD